MLNIMCFGYFLKKPAFESASNASTCCLFGLRNILDNDIHGSLCAIMSMTDFGILRIELSVPLLIESDQSINLQIGLWMHSKNKLMNFIEHQSYMYLTS